MPRARFVSVAVSAVIHRTFVVLFGLGQIAHLPVVTVVLQWLFPQAELPPVFNVLLENGNEVNREAVHDYKIDTQVYYSTCLK